jgi:hypothetical protein
MSPPSSGLKSKPTTKTARNRKQSVVFSPEDGGDISIAYPEL